VEEGIGKNQQQFLLFENFLSRLFLGRKPTKTARTRKSGVGPQNS
jgi:hypothetical protein